MSTPGEDCPPGKERNPNTRRCVKQCKPEYIRNSDFKCIREKRVANRISSNKTLKICPSSKERNPKTRRCINKCKSGYIRNSDFKCVREYSGKN